jgi:hypothetical protein
MADFIVRIDGLKLSKDAEASLNRGIQTAVLSALAATDTGGDFNSRLANKLRWRGIYVRPKEINPNIILEVNERQG